MKTAIVIVVASVAVMAALMWPNDADVNNIGIRVYDSEDMSNDATYGPQITDGEYAGRIGQTITIRCGGPCGEPVRTITGTLIAEHSDILVIRHGEDDLLIHKRLIER